MSETTPYFEARAVIAAIIVIEFREKKQVSIKEIAQLTSLSVERTHYLVNKLEQLGALRRITGPFEDKAAIVDETLIEQLKEQNYSANIEDEVAAFAKKQKEKQADIENLFKSGGEDKKDMFASLQDQLKTGGPPKKENPLDALSKGKKQNQDD